MAGAGLTVLLLGDVVGQPGMRSVFYGLPPLLERLKPRLTVVNAENSADGYGTLPEQAKQLILSGAQVITGGNHTWEKMEYRAYLGEAGVLRPANYSPKLPGTGFYVQDGTPPIAVINLQGRTRMAAIGDPFEIGMDLVQKARKFTSNIIIDFHAEATDEKEAFALCFDGLVSAVVGTHTHIPTADDRILPKGTFLMCDLGMCGSTAGVIGGSAEASVARLVSGVPVKSDPPDTNLEIQGVFLELDAANSKVKRWERVRSRVF